MNEKLTTEQREEFMTEAWANFEYAEIDGQTRNVITLAQLFEILNSHTAEDEDMCQCFTCQGSSKWTAGQCPDSERPSTEDEPIRIKDYDGYIFSIDKLPRKIANQIALRKWKEYEHWLGEWNGDDPAPQEHMTFDDWLQQEDK